MRRRAWVWLICVALMACYGVWRCAGGQALQTDLLAMLPDTERNPVAEAAIRSLARSTGDRAMFLVRAGDEGRSKAAALRLAGALARSGAFLEVQSTLPEVDPGAVARFYGNYRFRLPVAGPLPMPDTLKARRRPWTPWATWTRSSPACPSPPCTWRCGTSSWPSPRPRA
jgi:predicted exporter